MPRLPDLESFTLTREANKADAISVSKEVRLAPALLFLLMFSLPTLAQGLPDKIRGYKVHQDKVLVDPQTVESNVIVKIGEPEVADIELAGITFEFPAEFTAPEQSGKVDRIAFYDIRVNGIAVQSEGYLYKFEFRMGEEIALSKPVRFFLPAYGVVKAAWKEVTESRAEWQITGRVFVFGRFRRYGFYHKRVVPIDLNLTIKNPLHRK
jgi:hypothetical protein